MDLSQFAFWIFLGLFLWYSNSTFFLAGLNGLVPVCVLGFWPDFSFVVRTFFLWRAGVGSGPFAF